MSVPLVGVGVSGVMPANVWSGPEKKIDLYLKPRAMISGGEHCKRASCDDGTDNNTVKMIMVRNMMSMLLP